MQVESTESRDGQQLGFQDLSIGRHNESVGLKASQSIEYLGPIDSFRLEHGHASLNSHFLDRIHVLMMTATCFFRLSQHTRDGMFRFQQGTKRRQSKFARSHQDKF